MDQMDLWKNYVALTGITLGFLILTYIQLIRIKKTIFIIIISILIYISKDFIFEKQYEDIVVIWFQ